MGIGSFLLFVSLGALSAWFGDRVFRGKIPGGFLTATIFGILGAWIGGGMIVDVGPSLFGVAVLPSITGSVLLVVFVALIFSALARPASANKFKLEHSDPSEELPTNSRIVTRQ